MPVYILILGFTIGIDYYAAIYIEQSENSRKKQFLIASLLTNIGVLAVFKYYNFITENLSVFLKQIGYETHIPTLSILLPIGLSFHTFQAMSYTIEVYRGNQKAEKNLGIYALYVMFYPQLVAGPIERPQNILHQFHAKKTFDYSNFSTGIRLMTWGLFKKVVIADRLALCVNKIYENPYDYHGLPLIVATIFFAIQIYCDFSGYSDMALGAARVMGFKLMKNFDTPYFSTSVSEFWKRWHISLSTWFKDYFYIALGGNRVSVPRVYCNLLLTFLVSGLWHGANWTFIIWGGLNSLFLIIEHLILKNLPLKPTINTHFKAFIKLLKTMVTFLLICLTWIFFRAENSKEGVYIICNLLSNLKNSVQVVLSDKMGINKYDIIIALFAISLLFIVEYLHRKKQLHKVTNSSLRVLSYAALLLFIILFGVFDSKQQFIYFQF